MKKKFQNIINEIDELFVEELDLKVLSERATTLLSNKAGFIGAGILIKKNDNLTLHSFSKNRIAAFINDLVGDDYSWVQVNINNKQSLFAQSINEQKMFFSDNLSFFSPSSKKLEKLAQVVHKTSKAQKYLVQPIVYQNDALGVALFSTQKKSFSDEQIELVKVFCTKLAFAFKNSIEHEKILKGHIKNISTKILSSSTRQLNAIKSIHNLLATKTSLEDAYNTVVSELVKTLDVKHAVFLKWDNDKKSLSLRDVSIPKNILLAVEKFSGKTVRSFVFQKDNPLHSNNYYLQSILKNKTLVSSDLLDLGESYINKNIARKIEKVLGTKITITVPLIYNSEKLGVLGLSWTKDSVTDAELEIIKTFGEHLSLAIHNIRREQKIKSIEYLEKQHQIISDTFSKLAVADKNELKESLQEIATHFSKEMNFVGVNVFYHKGDFLETFLYSKSSQAEKIIGKFFSDREYLKLKLPLEHKSNLTVKTFRTQEICSSDIMTDFGKGGIDIKSMNVAQKILKIKATYSFPILFNKKPLGILIVAVKENQLSDEVQSICKIFAQQLGFALDRYLSTDAKPSYHDKILATTNQLFSGEFDFDNVSEKAVTEFNQDMGFYSTNIYRKDGRKLRAYLYSKGSSTSFIKRILSDEQYRKITIPLDNSVSIIARAGEEMEMFETQSFTNFSDGIVSERLVNLLKAGLPKDIWHTSFPITSSNQLEGVLAIGKRGSRMTDDEKEATTFFCEQLGLAMANIKAHNRIIERYQKQQEQKAKNIDPDKKPTIKFTLRISKEIERYLSWKINNTDKSKADFLRDLITEDVMQNDTAYQEFRKDSY